MSEKTEPMLNSSIEQRLSQTHHSDTAAEVADAQQGSVSTSADLPDCKPELDHAEPSGGSKADAATAVCNKKRKSACELSRRKKRQHTSVAEETKSNANYQCNQCLECFEHKLKLKIHLKNVHELRLQNICKPIETSPNKTQTNYQCEICLTNFKNQFQCLSHLKNVHNKLPDNEISSVIKSNDTKSLQKSNDSNDKTLCNKCGDFLNDGCNLEEHKTVCSKELTKKCLSNVNNAESVCKSKKSRRARIGTELRACKTNTKNVNTIVLDLESDAEECHENEKKASFKILQPAAINSKVELKDSVVISDKNIINLEKVVSKDKKRKLKSSIPNHKTKKKSKKHIKNNKKDNRYKKFSIKTKETESLYLNKKCNNKQPQNDINCPQTIRVNSNLTPDIRNNSTITSKSHQMTQSEIDNNVQMIKSEPADSDCYIPLSDINILVPKIELNISDTEIDSELLPLENSNGLDNYSDDDDDDSVSLYRCPYCMVTTKRHDIFRRHITVSSYTCIRKYRINANDESQTMQLPSNCNICNTQFSNRQIFSHHMNTHKLNVCHVCDRAYVYQCELNRHQFLKRHDTGVFECYYCNSKFCNEVSLKEHFSSTHEGLNLIFCCQNCKSLFNTSNELLQHCKSILITQLPNSVSELNKFEVCFYRQLKCINKPCNEMSIQNDASLIQIAHKDTRDSNCYCCCVCKCKYSNIHYLDQHFVANHMDQYLTQSSNETQINLIKNSNAQNDSNTEQELQPFESVIINETGNIKFEPGLESSDNDIICDSIIEKVSHNNISQLENNKIQNTGTKKVPLVRNKIKMIQLKVNNPTTENCSINCKASTSSNDITINSTDPKFHELFPLDFFFKPEARYNNRRSVANNINKSNEPTLPIETVTIDSDIKSDEVLPEDITEECSTSSNINNVTQLDDGSFWCKICECKVYEEHINVQHTLATTQFEPFYCPDCAFVFNTFLELRTHSKTYHPTSKKIFPYQQNMYDYKEDKRRYQSTKIIKKVAANEESNTRKKRKIIEKKARVQHEYINITSNRFVTELKDSAFKPENANKFQTLYIKNSMENKTPKVYVNKKRSKRISCAKKEYLERMQQQTEVNCEVNATDKDSNITLITKQENVSQESERWTEFHYFKCHLCNINYINSEDYIKHYIYQHGHKKSKFKCFLCDETFDSHTFRLIHFKHHSEVLVNCICCNKDIQHDEFMTNHFKTYVGDKCSFCEFSSDNIQDLCTHSRRHITLAESVYKCKSCSNFYYTKCNLQRHINTSHSLVM